MTDAIRHPGALRFGPVRDVITRALAARTCPAAVIEVGDAARPLWREAFGRLTYDQDAPAAAEDTVFDLASLTKVLGTTPLVMRQVERGALSLDDRISRYLSTWTAADRSQVSIRDLLAHCSGLPGHADLYREHRGRRAFERAIASTPLAYPPRTQSVYSDLGFMLLGFILEDIAPLPRQLQAMLDEMGGVDELLYNPPDAWKPRIAPTSVDPWRGRLLIGEVEDENAFALGGIASHAGLFGTAAAVGGCARHFLQVLAGRSGAIRRNTLIEFITRRADIPGSSRALGWDTMLPTSSCGTRMSPRAFGHTGFTGTSLWIDPGRGVYVVLLTNRVYPARGSDAAIRLLRREVHDAVMRALGH